MEHVSYCKFCVILQSSPQVSSSSSSDEEDLSDVFRASREQSNEELSDGRSLG